MAPADDADAVGVGPGLRARPGERRVEIARAFASLQPRAGADRGDGGDAADPPRREGIDDHRRRACVGGGVSHVVDERPMAAAAVQHDHDRRARSGILRAVHGEMRLKPRDALLQSFRERLHRHGQSQHEECAGQDGGDADRRARLALCAPSAPQCGVLR